MHNLQYSPLPMHQYDLADIQKAQAAWARYQAIDTESPEWDKASREWAERSQALAHMLIAKVSKSTHCGVSDTLETDQQV